MLWFRLKDVEIPMPYLGPLLAFLVFALVLVISSSIIDVLKNDSPLW